MSYQGVTELISRLNRFVKMEGVSHRDGHTYEQYWIRRTACEIWIHNRDQNLNHMEMSAAFAFAQALWDASVVFFEE